MMRAVLDTNLWISGILLPKSKAGQIIKAGFEEAFTIITSEHILSEIKKLLAHPKIQKIRKRTEEEIDAYIFESQIFSEYLVENPIVFHVERDPKDSAVLSTLLNSDAEYLITGDEALLSLRKKFSIITLNEFYNIVFHLK